MCARLAAKGLRETVMVDCSHGNSLKDHAKQADVAAAICEQVAGGSRQIFGAMLESHLVEGRQDYVPGQPAVYGQSITDACLSLEQTEPLLDAICGGATQAPEQSQSAEPRIRRELTPDLMPTLAPGFGERSCDAWDHALKRPSGHVSSTSASRIFTSVRCWSRRQSRRAGATRSSSVSAVAPGVARPLA